MSCPPLPSVPGNPHVDPATFLPPAAIPAWQTLIEAGREPDSGGAATPMPGFLDVQRRETMLKRLGALKSLQEAVEGDEEILKRLHSYTRRPKFLEMFSRLQTLCQDLEGHLGSLKNLQELDPNCAQCAGIRDSLLEIQKRVRELHWEGSETEKKLLITLLVFKVQASASARNKLDQLREAFEKMKAHPEGVGSVGSATVQRIEMAEKVRMVHQGLRELNAANPEELFLSLTARRAGKWGLFFAASPALFAAGGLGAVQISANLLQIHSQGSDAVRNLQASERMKLLKKTLSDVLGPASSQRLPCGSDPVATTSPVARETRAFIKVCLKTTELEIRRSHKALLLRVHNMLTGLGTVGSMGLYLIGAAIGMAVPPVSIAGLALLGETLLVNGSLAAYQNRASLKKGIKSLPTLASHETYLFRCNQVHAKRLKLLDDIALQRNPSAYRLQVLHDNSQRLHAIAMAESRRQTLLESATGFQRIRLKSVAKFNLWKARRHLNKKKKHELEALGERLQAGKLLNTLEEELKARHLSRKLNARLVPYSQVVHRRSPIYRTYAKSRLEQKLSKECLDETLRTAQAARENLDLRRQLAFVILKMIQAQLPEIENRIPVDELQAEILSELENRPADLLVKAALLNHQYQSLEEVREVTQLVSQLTRSGPAKEVRTDFSELDKLARERVLDSEVLDGVISLVCSRFSQSYFRQPQLKDQLSAPLESHVGRLSHELRTGLTSPDPLVRERVLLKFGLLDEGLDFKRDCKAVLGIDGRETREEVRYLPLLLTYMGLKK